MPRRLITMLAAGVLLLTACTAVVVEGSQPDPVVETGLLPSTTTTSSAQTTTTEAANNTTTEALVTTSTTAANDPVPEGSGCTPGTDALPDGLWYGEVATVNDGGLEFDLACWFAGEAAIVASAQDGEESPPPNDYYVRNQNPRIRMLGVGPDTPMVAYTTGDPASEYETNFSDWVDAAENRGFFFGLWVTIESGQVTSIEELWVP